MATAHYQKTKDNTRFDNWVSLFTINDLMGSIENKQWIEGFSSPIHYKYDRVAYTEPILVILIIEIIKLSKF